jgi:putative lipoic acid-binding regulatory protein
MRLATRPYRLAKDVVMDMRPSIEALESVHAFPCTYQMKVIGESGDEFVSRVVAIIHEELPAQSDLEYSVRESSGGRHVAVTLMMAVQSAEQVRAIYARLGEVSGVTMLL